MVKRSKADDMVAAGSSKENSSESSAEGKAPREGKERKERKDQFILVLVRDGTGTTVQAEGETFFNMRAAKEFAETLKVTAGAEVLFAPIKHTFNAEVVTETRLTPR